ncbi:MAG: DNA double-strand break repair nuclease NurA [Dehalococcoidia bacterium]
MSLNFERLAKLLDDLGPRLRQRADEGRARLAGALEAVRTWASQPDSLRQRLAAARTNWLLAEPLAEAMDATLTPPPAPSEYVALASDGSHIDVERHSPIPCYVLNLGSARIRYGSRPEANLASQPELAFEDERLVLSDRSDASREDVLSGSLLAALRSVREVELLARLATEEDSGLPTLALLDGTLVLWGLAREEIRGEAKRLLLDEGIIRALDALKALASQKTIALASYISHPASSEVMHTLRLAVCPLPQAQRPQPVDCRRCPREAGAPRPCDSVGLPSDRPLFRALLEPGQRSAVFRRANLRPSSIEAQFYSQHGVAFFYLRMPDGLPDEIARAEMPLWMAQDEQRVALLHALLIDQCRRGLGYPLACMEAHEQAVISGPERETFRQLLEAAVMAEGLPAGTSAKALSKRGRWL